MEKLLATARTLDNEDVLSGFRERFLVPGHDDGSDLVYFCGHSLGLQPKSTALMVQGELDAWQARAVRGHFEGPLPWMDYNQRLCESLAGLTGSSAEELVVMNTLTVNLHLLMVSFFRPRGTRRKILIEKHAFPSDRYAVQSQLLFHGLDPAEHLVELSPAEGAHIIEESAVEECLAGHGEDIALVLWPGVQYISGQAFDLPRIATAAREAGATIGFDLAHYIGNLPLELHDSGCDFAAWCHYKYLNAGPGAVGGCFVHERHHQDQDLPRFNGWWGNAKASRFRMATNFEADTGADAWQLSNPPILSMAPLRASLELFHEAGPDRLRAKSSAMTSYLLEGIRLHLDELLEVMTPQDPERRGSQLSLRVRSGRENGKALFEFLEQNGVLCDWREPDVIRVAPVPLYNRFMDCYELLRQLGEWSSVTDNPSRQSASG
ncbi:kynureninase [Pseudomonadota bacterium]